MKDDIKNKVLFKPGFQIDGEWYYFVNCPLCTKSKGKIRKTPWHKIATYKEVQKHVKCHHANIFMDENKQICLKSLQGFSSPKNVIGYPTAKEACKAHEMPVYTYYNKLRKGLSDEEIFSQPYVKTKVGSIGTSCQDHLGKWYKSRRERARAYGLNDKTVENRLKRLKWSLEKALTTPSHIKPPLIPEQVKDTDKRSIECTESENQAQNSNVACV